MDICVADAGGLHPGVVLHEFREGRLSLNLHSKVVEVEGSGMVDVIGRIHHPVNHLCATMVEATDGCAQTLCRILSAKREGVVVLGLEAAVSFMGGTLVVEFGEGGQTETFIIGEEKLPARRGSPGDVDTRVEAEAVADAGSTACHEASRERPMRQQHIVLQGERSGGAAVGARVVGSVAARTWPLHADIVLGLKVATEVRAEDVFVANECRDCRPAACPVEVTADLDAKDVRAMEVLAESGVMNQLEVVVGTIPED